MQVVGYLVEELRDKKNYKAFKHDMTEANIFIGSLIFIEELADKVCIPILNGTGTVATFCSSLTSISHIVSNALALSRRTSSAAATAGAVTGIRTIRPVNRHSGGAVFGVASIWLAQS